MRHGWSALLLLIAFAAVASAQEEVLVSARAPAVDASVRLHTLATQFERTDVRVSPDVVVARLMSFDRNGDGKVATAELSERMQVIVARGDTSGDGALDDLELRALTLRRLEFVSEAVQNRQDFRSGGRYGFGDSVGLISTSSHIRNTLDDLRLTPEANEEAKRIAASFVDQLENAARLKLRGALSSMLTEQQFVELERTLMPPGTGGRAMRGEIEIPCGFCRVTSSGVLERFQLTTDQIRAMAAALDSFKTDQQLDDARRSALVTQLAYVLTGEEKDNFRAALARRPVVQTPGVMIAVSSASR